MILSGRSIFGGHADGRTLVSGEPISFFGGVDPETGVVIEAGHPLEGRSIAGTILVLPHAKGSTVGSYVLYRLGAGGVAPRAIVVGACDPVVAAGVILAEIPCIDGLETDRIPDGAAARVDADAGVIEIEGGD